MLPINAFPIQQAQNMQIPPALMATLATVQPVARLIPALPLPVQQPNVEMTGTAEPAVIPVEYHLKWPIWRLFSLCSV